MWTLILSQILVPVAVAAVPTVLGIGAAMVNKHMGLSNAQTVWQNAGVNAAGRVALRMAKGESVDKAIAAEVATVAAAIPDAMATLNANSGNIANLIMGKLGNVMPEATAPTVEVTPTTSRQGW